MIAGFFLDRLGELVGMSPEEIVQRGKGRSQVGTRCIPSERGNRWSGDQPRGVGETINADITGRK